MTVQRMLFDVCGPLLNELGFKKRAGGMFTLDVAPGILGWLGLNRATQHHAPGTVEINPVVGVRFQEVERLVASCRGEPFHAYVPPTISTSVGYLMPGCKHQTWVFAPNQATEPAQEMVTAIATYGLPFMYSVASLGELRTRLDGRFGFEYQLIYRRPVALLLDGEVAAARRTLEMADAALGERADAAAADFKKFAAALFSRLPNS